MLQLNSSNKVIMESNNRKDVEVIESFIGLKVIAIWLLFYWHSNLPKCRVDLGARCCEFFL